MDGLGIVIQLPKAMLLRLIVHDVDFVFVVSSMRQTHQAQKRMQLIANPMLVVVLLSMVGMEMSEAASWWSRWLC